MQNPESDPDAARAARRRFLAACGRFAAVTPPTITLMLVAAERSYVAAQSGSSEIRQRGNNGFGNGGFDGTPNPRHGFQDLTR